MGRHQGLVWAKVQARLEVRPEKLWSLAEIERTGGEPEVVGQDKKSGEFVFMDCSAQSPKAAYLWLPAFVFPSLRLKRAHVFTDAG